MAAPSVLDNVQKRVNELDELHALSERLSNITLRAKNESDAVIMQYGETMARFVASAPSRDSSETMGTHALRLLQEKLDTAIRSVDQSMMLVDMARQRAARAERDYAQLARTVETISKQLRRIAMVAMSKVRVAPLAVDEDRDEHSPTFDDTRRMLVPDDAPESPARV